MMRGIQKLVGKIGIKAIMASAVMGVMPVTAMAGGHDHDRDDHGRYERHDWDRHDDHHDGGRIDIGFSTGPAVEAYRRPTQVWVEPVYTTVYDHIWLPETTKTVCDRVWVPDRYEWRDVVLNEYGYRRVCREQVLVEAGHYADVQRQVCVPAHYEDAPRQVCVTPGHWETRVEAVAVRPEPSLRFDLRVPVRW